MQCPTFHPHLCQCLFERKASRRQPWFFLGVTCAAQNSSLWAPAEVLLSGPHRQTRSLRAGYLDTIFDLCSVSVLRSQTAGSGLVRLCALWPFSGFLNTIRAHERRLKSKKLEPGILRMSTVPLTDRSKTGWRRKLRNYKKI